MVFDSAKNLGWAKSKEATLPGLTQLLDDIQTGILIIGASVFELYQIQEWIPPFKRRTGDIDLSIGIVNDASSYDHGVQILKNLNYKVDDQHPYRYHPPKLIPGGYSYIDLLAHPKGGDTNPEIATKAMGVGAGFSFKAFDFAQSVAFNLQDKVVFPNPIGMIALKRESYLDDPTKRTKDFADIIELVSGLVEKGTHFEISGLWSQISALPEAKVVKETLRQISTEDHRWDIEEIRKDLLQRNFDNDFIDTTAVQRVNDFLEQLN